MTRRITATLLVILGAITVGAAFPLPERTGVVATSRASQDSLPRLSPSQLRAWLAAHPRAVLLDVRTPAEFAAGHLAGAVNLDVQAPDFAERAAELKRGTPYVVYCRSGARSARAGQQLIALGHAPVVNGGGFEALAREGLPTAQDEARR
ncbi:MAG TPA: rhodanese-like domain-containing protein [Gemmatimonadaceae bacterium]|nr:rhodanese-like domain-containing protein [Gemmatimonadaceae bacterium]